MMKSGCLAALVALVGLGLVGKAQATVVVPVASPVPGTSSDLLILNGSYAGPLPSPITQPFSALAFTFSMVLPAQSEVSFLNSSTFALLGLSGSYSNGGQTELFTNGSGTFFGGLSPGFSVDIANLLKVPDSFQISVPTTASLFTVSALSGGGQLYTFNTGPFLVASGGSASYVSDPPVTGAGSVAPVPEPGGIAVLALPLLAMALISQGRSRRVSI